MIRRSIKQIFLQKRLLFKIMCAVFCSMAVGRYFWLSFGPDSWEPRFACSESIYNFGEVPKSRSVEHSFIVSNTGRKPLHIVKVTPSCGACLSITITKNEIAPNESSVIKAVLDVSKLDKGKVAKSMLVETDDPNFHDVILYVAGTIIEHEIEK
jgi:hypothetical protein